MAYEDHHRASNFEQMYRCYPVSFIEKPQLEMGDKIIMPPSALDRLASLHIDYPMLFELKNPDIGRVTHCGVLEFVADEGVIYMPYWMMENMLLREGDIIRVKNVSLVKGTFVKLQPHTMDFLDISNPKAILETTLRNYSCLTTGDTIMVPYNNKKYYIDVVETKPNNSISIIETDCEVDFATPLDYKEPEKIPPPALSKKRPREATGEEEAPQKKAQFNAFSGSSRRLNDQSSSESVPSDSSASVKQPQVDSESQTAVSETPSVSQHPRKLVFGSNTKKQTPNETDKVSANNNKQEASPKAEGTKFQAFTGQKYSLRS